MKTYTKTLLFTFILFVLGVNASKAQSDFYTNLEWDPIRLGVVIPESNSEYKGGLSFGTELRYNLSNDISIGMGLNYIANSTDKEATKIGLSGSYVVVGDYYLRNNSITRAFVGFGFGYKIEGDYTLKTNSGSEKKKGVTGEILTPRVGYEFGHIRLMASYDLGFKKELTNSFSLSLAFTLGGGRK